MSDKWVEETNPDGMGWTSQSHPSYGVIGVSRVTGKAALFDSDVKHGHFIEITISEAKKTRTGFSHEHIMGQVELARIRMSFAQFAQFITTQNVGAGTPCTLVYVQGDKSKPYANQWGQRPDPPDPKPFLDKFKKVGKERAQGILDKIETTSAMLKKIFEGDVQPTKKNLKVAVDAMASAKQDVKYNLPYLMECLDEEMEVKMSSAVTEFESYVASSLQDKGLEVLQKKTMRLDVGVIHKSLDSGEKP